MTMNLQIVSDLHIDHHTTEIQNPLDYFTPSADILVLAGDIGSLYKYEQFSRFIKDTCALYTHVLYVSGNHEYYQMKGYEKKTLSELNNLIYSLDRDIPNFHFLNRKSVKIGDLCIIGCTLWSKINFELPKYIVRIYGMNSEVYNTFNQKDIAYINKMIQYSQENNLKLVVITHHCPTYSVKPVECRSERSALYYNELDHLLTKDNVDTWIFGHTHIQCDTIMPEGTRLVANQKGKPKENIEDYSKDFVVNV